MSFITYHNFLIPIRPNIVFDLQLISYEIRSKPNWSTKYQDPTIRSKWEREIRSGLLKRSYHYDNLDHLIKYVFDHLKYFHYIQSVTEDKYDCGLIDYIFCKDDIINPDLKTKFLKSAQNLEANEPKDYHPNSNDQVLDLLHPSLYTLRYGYSPVLIDNKLKIVEHADAYKPNRSTYKISQYISENFQWLPTVFKFNKSSDAYEIQSYINNLHPFKYTDLYNDIQKIFNSCLNGLSLVLSRAETDALNTFETFNKSISIPFASQEIYDESFQSLVDGLKEKAEYLDYGFQYDVESYIEKLYDDGTTTKHLLPYSNKSLKFPIEEKDFKVDLLNLKELYPELKVIVKLANIELTPENPTYNGGSWHVEGCDNEKIVATILYYYENDNITGSSISFRAPVACEDFYEYEQDATGPVWDLYSLSRESRAVSNQGHINCTENRLLVFPNFLQHHVNKFSLLDKTKPGTRKILCFFVVDPSLGDETPVFSTSDVPIQRKDWWDDQEYKEEFKKYLTDETRLQIQELIHNNKVKFEWPILLEESKTLRLQLMKERSSQDKDESNVFNNKFCLCEH
ncbi:DUF4246 domain-containing protein ASCRUDRAFT_9517 [Ascoidea rubescens DSM 1968]|uniref:DUF4246 domain-containing protein n=1 Tax=Ascoidea rubescens DSM 1968 TaxID=1344418 RepID=A0A1D2V9D0_9ASCO|nr:hypothetical protein ASCRUDRAFT_10300 [Ascoidea rubescens DSM 1968]XP_020045785.1 hypothetical protein ASCRUDRAFT_9517 [Ascoidea rubescens DSM 1968]ODV58248.1 hypothetical protein ASCRUDRAFT_10300 [Ascoidea rubescens DSM 1968]ODV59478.1 hypothetical protein ASCRUDRAFT_9517 [Ascoidea rubescens DSM 1968]